MSIVLRSRPSYKRAVIVQVVAYGLFLFGWWLVTAGLGYIKPGILPSPTSVITSFIALPMTREFWLSMRFSLLITIVSSIEALCITIPLGLLIGLHPDARAIFEKPLAALRYLPLTALLGVFMTWFGYKVNMKVQFLTLSILVYFLPAFVARIDAVTTGHLNTIKTLGANNWQTIKKVYWPSTIGQFFTDMRVLSPIGWTYIILAETINLNDGGIGQMIFSASRRSHIDVAFALLLHIVCIAFIQDKVLMFADKKIFPYKYVGGDR
ncbi:MAG: ABC transporter permease subunit [Minisyncoccia bacterium]